MFIRHIDVILNKGVTIDRYNRLQCGWWILDPEYIYDGYKYQLPISENAVLGYNHYFDVVGSISIGKRTQIAGIGSQFWTHGAGTVDRDIVIGNDCYIDSQCMFAPGASVGDESTVALGSVVTRKHTEPRLLIGGVLAQVLKRDYYWKDKDPHR